jgi:hypothetical protein
MDVGQVITLRIFSYVFGRNSYLEQRSYGSKSLEKTYMSKSIGIPEYYLDGNVEFLGEAWKNQGL